MPAQDWKPSISALVLELGAKTIMAIWQSKSLGSSGGWSCLLKFLSWRGCFNDCYPPWNYCSWTAAGAWLVVVLQPSSQLGWLAALRGRRGVLRASRSLRGLVWQGRWRRWSADALILLPIQWWSGFAVLWNTWQTGKVPAIWKCARVALLPKGANDWRPLSIASVIWWVGGSHLVKGLRPWLSSFLDHRAFGGAPGRSVNHAICIPPEKCPYKSNTVTFGTKHVFVGDGWVSWVTSKQVFDFVEGHFWVPFRGHLKPCFWFCSVLGCQDIKAML